MSKQESFLKQLHHALDEIQAIDVVTLDVSAQTTVTDYMIICNGRSSRHVKAIAEFILEHMKMAGLPALSANGLEAAEWVLIDLGDFVVHVMQENSRTFYNLEGLWQKNILNA